MTKTFIYGLTNPDTGAIRYVGKTNDPHMRYNAHLSSCSRRRGTSHKESWIGSLLKQSKWPGLVILMYCPICWWQLAERGFIAAHRIRQTSDMLTNSSDGGDSPEIYKRRSDQVTESEAVNTRELHKIGWTVSMLGRYYRLHNNVIRDIIDQKTWECAPEHNYYRVERNPRWTV